MMSQTSNSPNLSQFSSKSSSDSLIPTLERFTNLIVYKDDDEREFEKATAIESKSHKKYKLVKSKFY